MPLVLFIRGVPLVSVKPKKSERKNWGVFTRPQKICAEKIEIILPAPQKIHAQKTGLFLPVRYNPKNELRKTGADRHEKL